MTPDDASRHSDQHTEDEPRVSPESPDTKVTDSDPGGNGPAGLAGGMGVSSERTGHVPGAQGEATHGAVDPYPDLPKDEDPPPEQSAGGSEVQPENELPPHPFDRRSGRSHSHG